MHLQLEKTYLGPKTQAPSAKPLLSTPALVDPLPNLGTWHHRVKKFNVSDVIGRILSEKVCLSVGNYWLCLQRSGGISRKQPPEEATSFAIGGTSKAGPSHCTLKRQAPQTIFG